MKMVQKKANLRTYINIADFKLNRISLLNQSKFNPSFISFLIASDFFPFRLKLISYLGEVPDDVENIWEYSSYNLTRKCKIFFIYFTFLY